MFFQRKRQTYGSQLAEHYVPANLPKHGNPDLGTFITGDYKLLSEDFLSERYHACEQKLDSLLATTDAFTVGAVFDSYIDSQISHLENFHQQEVAMHEVQGQHIRSAQKIRSEELDQELGQTEGCIQALKAKIAPLQGKHAQFDFKIGNIHLPLGILVTIAAMIIDAALNYSFLQDILFQNVFLLWITVACWSVLSDGTMCALGALLSRKGENYMGIGKPLFWAMVSGLLGLFLLSVVAGVLLRFGSMSISYGTINAQGEFVGKEIYTLAEYAITLVTSFLTPCTGLLSFLFSLDIDAGPESRRRKLEKELSLFETKYIKLKTERTALELTEDPMVRDRACQQAAEANLQALQIGLKMHVRKLLAQHQADASYTDAMSASATQLLDANPSHKDPSPAAARSDCPNLATLKETI